MDTGFCTAEHENAMKGCYGDADHTGPHWAYSSRVYNTTGQIKRAGDWIWEWSNEAPAVPEGSVAVVLTREELAMLVTLLAPVKQFFPVLEAKLGDTKDEL